MVRNRSTNRPVENRFSVKSLIDRFAGAMLMVSAVMVWLVIIAAVSFLMIDNDRLKESIRVQDQYDGRLREDIDKNQQFINKNQRFISGVRDKVVDFEKRLEKLEESQNRSQ